MIYYMLQELCLMLWHHGQIPIELFVTAAELLHTNGLQFIGVVKTTTRRFPMAYLSRLEIKDRG